MARLRQRTWLRIIFGREYKDCFQQLHTDQQDNGIHCKSTQGGQGLYCRKGKIRQEDTHDLLNGRPRTNA